MKLFQVSVLKEEVNVLFSKHILLLKYFKIMFCFVFLNTLAPHLSLDWLDVTFDV